MEFHLTNNVTVGGLVSAIERITKAAAGTVKPGSHKVTRSACLGGVCGRKRLDDGSPVTVAILCMISEFDDAAAASNWLDRLNAAVYAFNKSTGSEISETLSFTDRDLIGRAPKPGEQE